MVSIRFLLTGALLFFIVIYFQKYEFTPRRVKVPLLTTLDPASSLTIEWPKKFRFLGKGHQVFAFESEDEKFVLKFFDRQRLKDRWYVHLPFRFAQKKKRRLADRISIYPQSYRLAFEWLRNETALLAVHQGQCANKYPIVEVIDSSCRRFKIDLNEVPFILQKKVMSSLPKILEKAIKEGTVRDILSQFLTIHRQRISLQIGDLDRDIYGNYGSDGNRLVYLDPARFYLDKNLADPLLCRAEWLKVTTPVRKWLLHNAPQEVPFFDEEIKQFLDWQRPRLYREGVCGNDGFFFGMRVFGIFPFLRS